jgi:Tol biopolymer transport system component
VVEVSSGRGWAGRVAAALAVAAALVLAPDEAFAFGKNKIVYESFDWRIYKSPHFDVYYYPEEEAMLEQVVSYAESQYTRLSQILDHEIPFRINLIIYRTHVEFEQTNISLGFIPEYVAAFSEPIADRMVIPIDLPPDELYALFGHELTHVFQFSILFQESISRAFRANTPGWVMEGMASFFAQDESSFDKMIIRDAVIYGLIPPIHRLQVTNFLTYRFGNAAFAFIEEKYGQEGLRTFIMEFRRSLLNNNIAKPIQDAFGIDGDEFDRQFKKYLQKKYLPILLEKKEPQDYGPEIARRRPGEEDVVNFSPALSPSGDLIAVLTTRWNDLDVAILSAKDGKVFRPLTKGFTNHYESIVYGAFQGKKDLTWSPDGDRVAFFARKENERILLIHSALNGNLVRTISIPGVDDEVSPAWSPDGKSIAFEGVKEGVTDIFAYDLETGAIRNLTQDPFFDSNPSWSPDGTQILYNRRIGPYSKVFLADSQDPSRKVQLTFGDSDDLQPSFSRDTKTVYYTSDADGGIYNLHRLSLDSGDIARLTSLAGGAFTPAEMPGDSGRPVIAYAAYTQGRLRIYRMEPGEPEAVLKAADQGREPADLQQFEPPLRLSLDEAAKKPYDDIHFHMENAPSIYVGVADDGTFLGSAQVLLSDLLGDRRMLFDFQTVSNYSNFYFQYQNLTSRLNWGVYAQDYRDYYVVQSVNTGAVARTKQATSISSAGVNISWPFDRYYRLTGSAGYAMRSMDRPYATLTGTAFLSLDEQFPTITWRLDGDTTRFKSFGPFHGQRFQLSQQWAPILSATGDTDAFATGPFINTSLDYRLYRKISDRSLFAIRLASYISQGDGYSIYSLGGLNYLRGYDFREMYGSHVSFANFELRFPLVDALAFPFGILRDIRGFAFLDVGAAWFQGGDFSHPQLGYDLTASRNGQLDPFTCFDSNGDNFCDVRRKFDFWDSKNDKLGDGRASYGFGFNVWLGPFQLTWVWAHQLENTVEVCDLTSDPVCNLSKDVTRIDDPFHVNGTVGQFYIATDF